MRRLGCCTTFRYPCLYPNSEQSYTKTCLKYWLPDASPVTETIPANTIYSPNCKGEADAIAAELAELRAEQAVYCMPEWCPWSVCVSLANPSDVQHLEYWTPKLGVLFNQTVTICVDEGKNCSSPGIGFFVRFREVGTPSPSVIVLSSGGECAELQGGVLYNFGINQADAYIVPEQYSIGWDCDSDCPPPENAPQSITSFPAGIARAPDP